LNQARFQHINTILDNRNVFIASGAILPVALQSCEIFHVNLQTWSLVQNMAYARNLGSLVSLMSISPSLLITARTETADVTYSSSELYYPLTNTIIPSSDMTYQRLAHSSNLIYYQSTPSVVVVGGYDSSYNEMNSIQLFIVANSTWINIARLNTRRGEQTATLLNTSTPSILTVGGRTDTSSLEILTF
jgi:hypothetical protein